MYTEASTNEHGQSEFAIKGLTVKQLDCIQSAIATFINSVINDFDSGIISKITIIDELEFLTALTNQLKEQLILQVQLEKQCKALVKFQQPRPLPYIIIHPYEL